jgi:YidC/Oxa1 family membrane protein insertase
MQSQDPDQTRNVMLAVTLSIAVLFAWQYFYAGPQMRAEQERQRRIAELEKTQQAANQPPAAGQTTTGTPAATGAPVPAPGAANPGLASIPRMATVDRATAIAADKRVEIDTPALIGSINLKGGRVDDIVLRKYGVSPDPDSDRVVYFSPGQAPNPYFAETGWTGAPGTTAELPTPATVWTQTSDGALTPSNPVVLTWTSPSDLTFERTIAVDENYLFTITDEVTNNTGAPVTLYPYGRIFRYGTPKVEGFFIQHEGLIGVLGPEQFTEVTYGEAIEPGGGKTIDRATGGWVGITDKYWAAALIPDQTQVYRGNLSSPSPTRTALQRETFQADYLMTANVVAPGQTARTEAKLFVGAKEVNLIETYETQHNILQFELLVDWGWFYFITKPLYHLLDILYRFIGNFGFAILAVTIIVKAMFFWFANKSYESMAKMKKLQPEMERLKAKHKDDKMELQKEMMALYQKEKINPLAGCLPVLIQIPVFFALYKVLFISIDMRHAPFVGWINDLSAPDPTTIFNLFGLLPYSVPEWLPLIGIWPVFMGITMWMQMQLNPQQPDPMQQAIFNWMPVLFTVLLASFPAGLVIYWAWNNVLSLAQQYFIMKRQGVDVHLVDNLKKTGAAAKNIAGGIKRIGGKKE